jgi:thiol-disulfide isomerase/thioredoxin
MVLFCGNDIAHVVRLLVLIVLVFVSACSDPIPPLPVDKGQTFPSLAVLDLKGESHTLAMPADKVTVLNIWATWCGPCRYEMPSLQKLADQLDATHFQVIGLSIDDDKHPANEFLIERKIRFKNYHDPAQRVTKDRLGLRAYPTTYVIVGNRVQRVVEGWRDWSDPEMVKGVRALVPTNSPGPSVGNPPKQPS